MQTSGFEETRRNLSNTMVRFGLVIPFSDDIGLVSIRINFYKIDQKYVHILSVHVSSHDP